MNVPIIWVLGGPGSGKGTQCEKIAEKYGFTHLSTGDLLRSETNNGTSRGQNILSLMEKGELVPIEIVLNLLKEAISANLATSKGFLIDGYPREKIQGIQFEEQIAPVSLILYFEASDEILTERLLERAKSSGRADDNEVTIKARLKTFNEHNMEILNQYPDKIKKISAEGTKKEIFENVELILDNLVTTQKNTEK